MGNTENFTNKENLKQIDWVDSEIKAELSALGKDVESFYEIKQDSIEFKEDIVKEYLSKLKDEVKDMDSKAAWEHLASKENNAAWIMAVQIVLEKLGYEVGKIDGVLGKETKNGVLRFQTQCDLGGKDGFPGKETITKLCEALDNPDQFAAKLESKPVTGSASASSTSTESSGASGGGEQLAQASSHSEDVASQEQENSGNLDEGYQGAISLEEEKQVIVDEIKNKFGNILKDKKGDTINLTSNGQLTLPSIVTPGTFLRQDIDLAKCLDKNANVDKRRTEKVLNEGIKKLINKKKAETGWYLLKKDYRGRGSGGKYYISAENLKLDDNSLSDLNPLEKGRIKRYFNKFDYYGIELDGADTTYDLDNGKIKLVLDDDSTNEKYNHYDNNEDLVIDADKVVKNDYTLNMNEFYKIMRGVIINIIRREDFE